MVNMIKLHGTIHLQIYGQIPQIRIQVFMITQFL